MKDYTWGYILLMVMLGIFGSVIIGVGYYSIKGALILIWSPVAIIGTFLIGKKYGRSERN
ncbi:hypothetical protein [Enterococcus sp.]|uniref:hypothetical protein n=1 Tax=Enterococcus sp. TaxID=35783 RepID=UPI003C76AC06